MKSSAPGTNEVEPHDDQRLAALRRAIDEGEASGLAEEGSFARVRARVRILHERMLPQLHLGGG
jgi:hypothetical protein